MLAILAAVVIATQPVPFDAPEPSPAAVAPVVWRFQGASVTGYWFSPEQVMKIDARITYLEQRAAQECTSETQKAIKGSPVFWFVASGVIVGVLGGFLAARAIR